MCRLTVFIIAITNYVTCLGNCQIDEHDLLRWLPKGYYYAISVIDNASIREAKSYNVYRECFDPKESRFTYDSPLGISLASKARRYLKLQYWDNVKVIGGDVKVMMERGDVDKDK